MSNVVTLPVETVLNIDPDRVLVQACAAGLERVVIIGVTADGEEYFAASEAHGGTVLWDLERAKRRLLKMGDD